MNIFEYVVFHITFPRIVACIALYIAIELCIHNNTYVFLIYWIVLVLWHYILVFVIVLYRILTEGTARKLSEPATS